jgi:hypothetical protein
MPSLNLPIAGRKRGAGNLDPVQCYHVRSLVVCITTVPPSSTKDIINEIAAIWVW